MTSGILASSQADPETTEPAFVRHRWVIHDLATLRRSPSPPARSRSTPPSPLEGLTAAQLEERFAPVLRDLESDLRGGRLSPHQAYATFDALGSMGEVARPSVPTIVSVLDAWDQDAFFRVPYLCSAVRALAQIAPTAPDVIKVLSDALDRELPSRGSVCHRCGCLLEALERSGPAAREVAGPVLERIMAEPRFLTTYDHQLGRALQAVGIGPSPSVVLRRVTREDVGPRDRAETLRALAKEALAYGPSERSAVRETAAGLLTNDNREIRAAAALALGATGPEAVAPLLRALDDWHFEVRIAAAQALGRLGTSAQGAAVPLAAALDPYLGTALAAGEALVAIGPGALPAIEAQHAAAAAPLRPIVRAAAHAVQAGRIDLLRAALARHVPSGPHGRGFARVDVRRAGNGQLPYDPGRHRIRVSYTVRRYAGPARSPESAGDRITSEQTTSTALLALRGRRAGDRVELLLSPDIAQSPGYGTSRHSESWRTHVAGTPGFFDVTIERVCEPVAWTVFRGSGIWGPIRFELYCRD